MLRQNCAVRKAAADPALVAQLYDQFTALKQETDAVRAQRNENSAAMKVGPGRRKRGGRQDALGAEAGIRRAGRAGPRGPGRLVLPPGPCVTLHAGPCSLLPPCSEPAGLRAAARRASWRLTRALRWWPRARR